MKKSLAAFALISVAVLLTLLWGSASGQSGPEYRLGFRQLADQIPEIVGDPLEGERHEPNGDAIQPTTRGLMVWRKADNWAAFTNGSRTWINGPFGTQSRANSERFPWEAETSPTMSPLTRQPVLIYADEFRGGVPQLPWLPFPFFNGDNMQGTVDTTSPGGEAGVGVLTNETVGGFAALSYVGRNVPQDFRLESWVHFSTSEEETGPLNGLAFRVDPRSGGFYRVASQFIADRELTLAYVGPDTRNFPVYLARWRTDDLPGGAPTESGWHRLAVEVVDDRAEVYWDGTRLPGGPYLVDRVPTGYVGAYATFVGGLGRAETRVDDLRVSRIED